MGIRIRKILKKIEQYSLVELTHGTENLIAKVWDETNTLKNRIGTKELLIEINYNELLSIKLIPNYNDSDSIITTKNNHFIVKGRVIQFVEMESDTLIDLYLQTGPEFISILKSEIGELDLAIDDGVELELTDVKFFPRNNE